MDRQMLQGNRQVPRVDGHIDRGVLRVLKKSTTSDQTSHTVTR